MTSIFNNTIILRLCKRLHNIYFNASMTSIKLKMQTMILTMANVLFVHQLNSSLFVINYGSMKYTFEGCYEKLAC